MARLLSLWQLPMAEKRRKGLAQRLRGVEPGPQLTTAWFSLAGGESRFREGDSLCLHAGTPFDDVIAYNVTLEVEEEHRWLLRFDKPGEIPEPNDVHFYAG